MLRRHDGRLLGVTHERSVRPADAIWTSRRARTPRARGHTRADVAPHERPTGYRHRVPGHSDLRFRGPIFLGDTVHVDYRIVEMRDSRTYPDQAIVTFEVELRNEAADVLQQGRKVLLVSKTPLAAATSREASERAYMPLPYDGITVLDFTQLEQGPSGTLMLADFGAQVIKIEQIDSGEVGRGQVPSYHGMSCHWAANNRNKLSLSINIKHPKGKELVLRVARDADIVASNFRPGVMERLGFGYEDLSRINPRIISAYASVYGQAGPYRDLRGQDLAAQAIGGVMDLTGDADGPPTPVGTFAIDFRRRVAMQFAIGIMAALALHDGTGVGQVVDTCLLNASLSLHHQEATAFRQTRAACIRELPTALHMRTTRHCRRAIDARMTTGWC